MKEFLATIVLCFSLSSCFNSKGLPAKNIDSSLYSNTVKNEEILDHSKWTALLQKHVRKNGRVDYQGFVMDKEKLQEYLDFLSAQKPDNSWPAQEQLAYYINAYNAYTIRLIVDNYPVKSIKDIGGIKGPFLKSFVDLGGKSISLAQLEKGILQKMNEPRIHFAINCASISCPKLQPEAFTASRLNEQLDSATKEFINSENNEISEGFADLSKIFDWYKKDFTHENDLIMFINQYSAIKISEDAKIEFKDYNWNLNDVE